MQFQPESNDGKLRVIVFGAHPDDCEYTAGGTAAKYSAFGHHVKFVSMTTGDNGHPTQAGSALGIRRRAEAAEAARRLGVEEYDVFENHGGELIASLDLRKVVVRAIRNWRADLVLFPRPFDYHPDHRSTSLLVQDAAYMVTVPFFTSDTPALRRNPVFVYVGDRFTRPVPIRYDVAVAIDDVLDSKVAGLDAHVSQMYEWDAFMLNLQPPHDASERRAWLRDRNFKEAASGSLREALNRWYGAQSASIRFAEGFEICELGLQPPEPEIRRLFPFFENI